ncbi:MAG: hypothetical protein KYX62_05285 [Pseudomonadota bacterium]|nr:hypothetical protein [Pseudomonadota bacterium]
MGSGTVSLSAAPDVLRSALADLLTQQPSHQAARLAGQQADTPGTAFFCGYQAAMRCLVPALPADLWAAFCISERGLRSLSAMQTHYLDGHLYGGKSHVMLAGQGLDRLYVVALDEQQRLVCVQVDATASGLRAEAPGKAQSFLPEVPHFPVTFDGVAVSALISTDAHRQLNRPFRYWEDVHVALAMAGWMNARTEAAALAAAADELAAAYASQPGGYGLPALDRLESLLQRLDQAAAGLTAEDNKHWQRDRMLLVLGQPLRQRIRAGLSAPSP